MHSKQRTKKINGINGISSMCVQVNHKFRKSAVHSTKSTLFRKYNVFIEALYFYVFSSLEISNCVHTVIKPTDA